MRKYLLIPALAIFFISSCSKKDDKVENILRPDPESRNQEGIKLLGTSRIDNGYIQWSTIYYEPNSNRIAKTIDSSMSLIDITDNGTELGVGTYVYDAAGKLIETHASNGPAYATFTYDGTGKLVQQNVIPDGWIKYAYDANNRIIEDSSFIIASNHYDSRLRYTYDQADNTLSEEEWQYDNNTNSLQKMSISTFTYDDKLSPYSGVDQNSLIFKIPPHNILTTNLSFTTGNNYQRIYTNTYNSFGLPKIINFASNGVGVPGTVTDKYYYY